MIEYPKDCFYYHSSIIYYRTESIPLSIMDYSEQQEGFGIDVYMKKEKIMKDTSDFEEFDRKRSIFGTWLEDTHDKLTDCINHDLKYMNLHLKFKKKPDLKIIETFIESNFKILKHIFIVVLS